MIFNGCKAIKVQKIICLFCLFEFYGISTFVGYLMPDPFFFQINNSISNNPLLHKYSLIVKNISISGYSVYSNSSNSNNSV